MSVASRFFRLCHQRQLPSSLATTTRPISRGQSIFQRRSFIPSSRHLAEPVDGTTQSDVQESEPVTADNFTSLFCGNLAFGVKEETILQEFGKHGTVTCARTGNGDKRNMTRNGWGGFNGGFCFIDFASHEEAGVALKAMDGVEIDGRPVTLKYYLPTFRKERPANAMKGSAQSRKPLSKQDEEYIRTQPLVIGTVSRTGTMRKTVAVTTNHRRLDKYTQTHHNQEKTELVHDPQGILVEGDVIKYQHFPPDLYAERSARGKKQVLFVLKEVVTPFGTPLEERAPQVADKTDEQSRTKKPRKGRSREKAAAPTAS